MRSRRGPAQPGLAGVQARRCCGRCWPLVASTGAGSSPIRRDPTGRSYGWFARRSPRRRAQRADTAIPVAARLRAGVRLHGLRPPGPRWPQRRTQHRTDCRRAGGQQHAQSSSGGEARTEPHAW